MDVFEALYTTHAMRRVKPDPIPLDIQDKILDARDPRAERRQQPELEVHAGGRPGDAGRAGADLPAMHDTALADDLQGADRDRDSDAGRPRERADVAYPARRAAPRRQFRGVPAVALQLRPTRPVRRFDLSRHVVGDARGTGVRHRRVAHLSDAVRTRQRAEGARRAEGRGLALLVVRHVRLPHRQVGVAPRRPVHEVAYRNGWGNPLGREIPQPLWSAE